MHCCACNCATLRCAVLCLQDAERLSQSRTQATFSAEDTLDQDLDDIYAEMDPNADLDMDMRGDSL